MTTMGFKSGFKSGFFKGGEWHGTGWILAGTESPFWIPSQISGSMSQSSSFPHFAPFLPPGSYWMFSFRLPLADWLIDFYGLISFHNRQGRHAPIHLHQFIEWLQIWHPPVAFSFQIPSMLAWVSTGEIMQIRRKLVDYDWLIDLQLAQSGFLFLSFFLSFFLFLFFLCVFCFY